MKYGILRTYERRISDVRDEINVMNFELDVSRVKRGYVDVGFSLNKVKQFGFRLEEKKIIEYCSLVDKAIPLANQIITHSSDKDRRIINELIDRMLLISVYNHTADVAGDTVLADQLSSVYAFLVQFTTI